MSEVKKIAEDIFGAHRDDHYLFFFQQEGLSRIMVDFKEITGTASCLFFILPGQVHQVLSNYDGKGWFMALDSSYVNDTYRHVFEAQLVNQQPISPSPETAQQLDRCFGLLNQICHQTQELHFQSQIIRSLIDTVLGFFASAYLSPNQDQMRQNLRPTLIYRQFKELLSTNFKTIKSPAAYANLLHISPAYLNEAIKQVTGFAVSYWIHQEIMLEAKRLLYYTNNTIKEIAYAIGYTDHAYFSRLFAKVVGQSPIQFRKDYHE